MTYFAQLLKTAGADKLAVDQDRCGTREKEAALTAKDNKYFEQVFLKNGK